jgi:hypothetical protein
MVRISSSADQIPAEWYSALKEVLHWYAWKLNPGNTGNAGATTGIDYFETTAYSILLIFAALILSQSSIFEFSERVKTSTIKLMLLFIILFILQAGSFLLNVSVLFSVSFGRISIFTSIFSVIIFASCITSIIQRKNSLKKIFLSPLLTFCLLIPSFLNFAFLGLILILNELKLKKSNKIFSAISLVFITLSILFARANYNNAWVNGSILKFIPDALQIVPNYLSLKMLENLSIYSWLLIYAILVAYSLKISKEYRKHIVVAIIILSTFFTLGGRYILSERRDIKHSDWIETQLWALNNSQEKSRFIVNSGFDVYESWTTLSRRPRLIADLNAGFLYFYTKEDLVYDQKRSLLPTAPHPKNTSATDLEAFYLNFSREYTGDYLVWKKEFIKLSFDKVYENKQFIIYDIP